MVDYHDPVRPPDIVLLRLKQKYLYDPITGIITHRMDNSVVRTKVNRYIQLYISIGKTKYRYYGHQFAWYVVTGHWPTKSIDHINRKRSDNRIDNLKEATTKEQAENRLLRPITYEYSNQSKYGKGIYFRRGRYEVYFTRNKKHHYLGVFKDVESAQRAIDEFNERES